MPFGPDWPTRATNRMPIYSRGRGGVGRIPVGGPESDFDTYNGGWQMPKKQQPRKSSARQASKDAKVVPLRDSALYRPLRKQGVSLAFGLDEVAGELVIRFPDGTFERTGLSLDDL